MLWLESQPLTWYRIVRKKYQYSYIENQPAVDHKNIFEYFNQYFNGYKDILKL